LEIWKAKKNAINLKYVMNYNFHLRRDSMSIKCSKCENRVFDGNAYLKISIIEKPQQEIVDKLTEDLKLAKEKFGKKSEEVADIQRALNIEKRMLKTIWQCKNAL
jgi:ribosomal protein L37AE/L43A